MESQLMRVARIVFLGATALVILAGVGSVTGCMQHGSNRMQAPSFDGVRRGWAVPLMNGGELVHLEWDAADPTGQGEPLVAWCHLRSRDDADRFDERRAAMLAEQGFSVFIAACVTWYDAQKSIDEKTEPWKQAMARARRKGLRDNWISHQMLSRNGHWNPHNPKLPSQPTDLFDDKVWEDVAANLRATIRFAKQLEARGLAIDIESYGETPLATGTWKDRPEEAAIMALRRGEQMANAMLDEWPGIEVMVLPAYYFWDGHRKVVGRRFAEPFSVGMTRAFARRQSPDGPGGIYPASEFTYGPAGDMSPEACLGRVDWVLEGLDGALTSVATEHPDYYEHRVRLASGVWPVGDYLRDEGADLNDRRYSPLKYWNMLEASRARRPSLVWIYNQNYAWFTSAWDEYAQMNRRFRQATRYRVYAARAQTRDSEAVVPVVSTPRLHARFSAAGTGLAYGVRASKPSGPEDRNPVVLKPRRLDGIADDFSDGMGPGWTVSSNPPKQMPNQQRGVDTLDFFMPAKDTLTEIAVGLDGPRRTSGSARLTIRSFQLSGHDSPGGVGLRLYADENHWVIFARTARLPSDHDGKDHAVTNVGLRWKSGDKDGKSGGFYNFGPGGEIGLDWNGPEGTLTWHTEGATSGTGTVEIAMPPFQVQIYAWTKKGGALIADVDDFILTELGALDP